MTPRHAYLIGIAGAGMRALADVLLGTGWRVSGSDYAPFVVPPSGGLRGPIYRLKPGLRTYQGHAPENLPPETDLVIASTAIPPHNPELLRAAELGIPVVSYFQMLGRLMEGKHGLAVAGTHGKSTTAAMAAQILVGAGLDPTVVFGATPLGACSGGHAGSGKLMLVEACECQRNFLHLRPRHAVILGIEPDHFDCYDTRDELERAFAQFAASLPSDGLLLARHDCEATRRATANFSCRVETFGLQGQADWSAANLSHQRGCYRFQIHHRGKLLGSIKLKTPGRHNVLNALAAAALASANGVSPEQVVRSLSRFPGLHRRLESLGTWGGVAVVDDYAHHPTEVAAALAAVRLMFPGRRLWCVFQPHQVSRTARLLDELAASLQNAEKVLVAEIFRAREGPARPGEVTAADLARQVRAGGADVPPIHAPEEIEDFLQTHLTPRDVLLTLGAGDIGRIAYGYLERFREDRAAG